MALLELEHVHLFEQTLELFTSGAHSKRPYLLGAAMAHRNHGYLAWQVAQRPVGRTE